MHSAQDIVLPVLSEASLSQPHLSPYNPKAPKMEHNITFFFAGTICGGRDRGKNCTKYENFTSTVFLYSGGVRQKASLEPASPSRYLLALDLALPRRQLSWLVHLLA
jgi:hypothetical protein